MTYIKRKIFLTEEQRKHRNKFVMQLYKETAMTFDEIGDIFGVSKQLISIIINNRNKGREKKITNTIN